ncbi:MAG: cytochrome c biogenesis protein CcsA [Bacteroidetes bacterium]|nr:cytochrome c biogenesis protein CcsA [Bacteroidota bacterium]
MMILLLINIIVLLLSIIIDIYYINKRKLNLDFYKKLSDIFFYVSVVIIALVYSLYVFNIFADNFEYAYVYKSSEIGQNLVYKFVAAHSGSSGAYLLWLLLASILNISLRINLNKQEKYINNTYLLRSAFSILPLFLSIILFVVNPFELTLVKYPELTAVPKNGLGLNPILCSYYNLFHPIFIFISYSLLFIPFISVIVGLIIKDTKNWLSIAVKYNGYALLSLSIALLLGMFWAYNSFGWGGLWNWDVIENSLLLVFILSIIFNSFSIIHRKSGGLMKSLHTLALITFPIVLFSTFIARSKFFANSIHAYSNNETTIAYILIAVLVLLFVFILIIMLKNIKYINKNNTPTVFPFFSKEMFIIISNLVLVVLCVVLFLGMIYPILVTLLNIPANPLRSSFYIIWAYFLSILYFVIYAISLILEWGKNSYRGFSNKIAISFSLAIIFMLSIFFAGINNIEILLIIFACSFTVFAFTQKIFTDIRKSSSFISQCLFYVGICILICFSVISSNETYVEIHKLKLGDNINSIYKGEEYKIKFDNINENISENKLEQIFNFTLFNNSEKITFSPKLIYYLRNHILKFTESKTYGLIDIHITPLSLTTNTLIPYNILQLNQERNTKISDDIKINLLNINTDIKKASVIITNSILQDTLELSFPKEDNKFCWESILNTNYECAVGSIFFNKDVPFVSIIYREKHKQLPQPIKQAKIEIAYKPYIIFVLLGGVLCVIGVFLNYINNNRQYVSKM